uniref:Uncharacterized protein n=1 Tax=Arundo donax TaxID=35708 RepID=A0A0A9AG97_ARUDO
MPQQNNLQGLGVSPQYQQHVISQLLQEVKNNNIRAFAQQSPSDTPNPNSGLASGTAVTSSAAPGEQQTQRINNNDGAVKGVAPADTGPSNVINSTAGIVPSRSNSFKSVSSNPAAATGGNATASKAEPFHEMDGLDHLISNELAESGLFAGEQGGNAFPWNMWRNT